MVQKAMRDFRTQIWECQLGAGAAIRLLLAVLVEFEFGEGTSEADADEARDHLPWPPGDEDSVAADQRRNDRLQAALLAAIRFSRQHSLIIQNWRSVKAESRTQRHPDSASL
jgi:hypothetical protein